MTTNARDEKWSEWIYWSGGECPLPDKSQYMVRFRLNNEVGPMTDPQSLEWNHHKSGGDIIAYRYKIKEPESDMKNEIGTDSFMTPEEENEYFDQRHDIDNVNHPQHYQSDNGIECIDAIRAALGLDGFVAHCRGTAIKYAFRAGKKQAHAEDLRKAAWYLTRAAEELEE